MRGRRALRGCELLSPQAAELDVVRLADGRRSRWPATRRRRIGDDTRRHPGHRRPAPPLSQGMEGRTAGPVRMVPEDRSRSGCGRCYRGRMAAADRITRVLAGPGGVFDPGPGRDVSTLGVSGLGQAEVFAVPYMPGALFPERRGWRGVVQRRVNVRRRSMHRAPSLHAPAAIALSLAASGAQWILAALGVLVVKDSQPGLVGRCDRAAPTQWSLEAQDRPGAPGRDPGDFRAPHGGAQTSPAVRDVR